MASTRKFNTRSVPKASDIFFSSNNTSNKNNNNKNFKVPTSGPNTPVNKTKKPSQIEVDPKPTDDLYIDTTTHDTPYSNHPPQSALHLTILMMKTITPGKKLNTPLLQTKAKKNKQA